MTLKKDCLAFGCFILLLFSVGCNNHKQTTISQDYYYYTSHDQYGLDKDTTKIDSLDFNIKSYTNVYMKYFNDKFYVRKYYYDFGPSDTETLFYWSNNFGIIYSKNIYWGGFKRLHSSNDSIERIINRELSFILSSQSLVLSGEQHVQYVDSNLKIGEIFEKKILKNKN